MRGLFDWPGGQQVNGRLAPRRIRPRRSTQREHVWTTCAEPVIARAEAKRARRNAKRFATWTGKRAA